MGTRETDQPPLWIATSDLPTSPGHPFYVEADDAARRAPLRSVRRRQLCDRFYAPVMGRPSLAPGRYFRLLLVGYFEGIDSERGIAMARDGLVGGPQLSAVGRGTRRHPIIRRLRARGA